MSAQNGARRRAAPGGARRQQTRAYSDDGTGIGPTPARDRAKKSGRANAVKELGWGRLIFAQTFDDNERLAKELQRERPRQRDIAIYLRDPHVVLSLAPGALFLDPSHTYRLWLHEYPSGRLLSAGGFFIRRVHTREDVRSINRIYEALGMVTTDESFVLKNRNSRSISFFVAEDVKSGQVIGTITGVDHVHAFGDPQNASSFWCLAVDPQSQRPGVGEALVRHLIEHYQGRGRAVLDLSVLHDNAQAIALYEKLGFQRVPVFCVKHKNPINEPLFVSPPAPEERALNPYSQIIVREAKRRGIGVEVLDEERDYFALSFGGRAVVCRESLTELTSAIAMSRAQDKRLTQRILERVGLCVPSQHLYRDPDDARAFLAACGRVVVKPVDGEQGAGVTVDVRTPEALEKAVRRARASGGDVIVEEYVEGLDLRVVLIGYQVVAAAVRRPPEVVGTGRHTVADLIAKQSRRRAAATGGESRIPLDGETKRCVADAGWTLESVLPEGEVLVVRKTANLHGGGTLHDVTDRLDPSIADACVAAATALDLPVTGLDLIVPRVDGPDYVIIEANERPGLANHEPQPTAERFIDLLFPNTAAAAHERLVSSGERS